MRRLVSIFGLVLLLIGGVAFNAGAIPITGGVSFSGTDVVNTGNLATATAFTSFNNVIVSAGGGTGNFAPLVGGTGLTMNGFTFSPLPVGGVVPWWTVTLGGITYSFDITSLVIETQTASQLNMSGFGMAHITGFDDTVGQWVLTANSLGGTFSFSGSSATIPEPLTLILLGSSLVGVIAFRRKL